MKKDLDNDRPVFSVSRDWQLVKPSSQREGEALYAYRANICASKRYAAQQVAVTSRDVIAAVI